MPIINPIYKIPIDPNLTAENLKAGVTIYPGTPYEVTGTLEGVTAPTLVRRTLEVGDI
jgi:hypothetical protein